MPSMSLENNNIKEVICHTKSGRMAVSAKIFIDTTGDADVAAYAGVPYEVGSPQFAGLNMSTTLAFRLANVNLLKYAEARQGMDCQDSGRPKTAMRHHVAASRAGRESSQEWRFAFFHLPHCLDVSGAPIPLKMMLISP